MRGDSASRKAQREVNPGRQLFGRAHGTRASAGGSDRRRYGRSTSSCKEFVAHGCGGVQRKGLICFPSFFWVFFSHPRPASPPPRTVPPKPHPPPAPPPFPGRP